jgi:hypothetical protein
VDETALDVDARNHARLDIVEAALAEVARLEGAVDDRERGLGQDLPVAGVEPRDADLAVLERAVQWIRVVLRRRDILGVVPAPLGNGQRGMYGRTS